MHEYAATKNTELSTAAFDIVKNLRAWKNLEVAQNVMRKAEERLSTLGALIRQKEATMSTLMKLQIAGFSEKDITELTAVVNTRNA